MKQMKSYLLVILMLLPMVSVLASPKSIKVKTPGTLAELIPEKQRAKIKQLALEGTLNDADLQVIRQMASAPTKGKGGKLGRLDLSNAEFSIKCTEYGYPDSVFTNCNVLTDVILPKKFKGLFPNSFVGCSALRTVTFNNVEYIAHQQFKDLPLLENVTIKGWLGHADGTPFMNLPKLKKVTFGDNVLSTGGPVIAQNCPVLEQILFKGVVLNTGWNAIEGCPLVKRCTVEGYTASQQNELIKGKPLEEGGNVLANSIYNLLKNNLRKPGEYYNFAAVEPGDIYNIACFYSLAGDVENALRFLEFTYQVSPIAEPYAHIMKDTDLDNIRETAKFKEIAQRAREATDYVYILKNCPPYEPGLEKDSQRFSYASASEASLKRINDYFKLDSIAGNGDEVSRIKNVMYWLHDAIRHDGSNGIPQVKRSAIELYEACKKENRGLNCRGLAIVLSELYLAMGYPARFVTCQSKAYDIDSDCHVICMVWSKQLNKWLWMDPSFAAFVSDENGYLLGIAEVRERLRTGQPLVLNEDANWNHRQKQTKEYYLETYMAKNLYYLSCYLQNGANAEGNSVYVTLQPKGCSTNISTKSTADDAWFWQSPQ